MGKLGLVHVYTGDGKGKTSAAIGLAVRAVGQSLNVFIIQFMKGGAYTGEMIASKNFLPNIEFIQYGRHCIKEQKQMKLLGFQTGYDFYDKVRDDITCGTCRFCFVNDKIQANFVNLAMRKAEDILSSGDYDLVILDEICAAYHYGFLSVDGLSKVFGWKKKKTELVLTGRGAPKQIMENIDYWTEFKEIKHPFKDKNIMARRGVEY